MADIGTYTGSPLDVLIADRTNPWVEVDGQPVDWDRWTLTHLDLLDGDNDCDTCGNGLLVGVIAPMDTAVGVQRCDECGIYDGDLSAAFALAQLVGGTVRFEVG